jgi:hypothetical protein
MKRYDLAYLGAGIGMALALLLLIAGHALSAGAALVFALLFHLNGDGPDAA